MLPCPNCGYCPHCGRGGWVRQHPWQWPTIYPKPYGAVSTGIHQARAALHT